jgi:hypothetical protein
MGIMDEQTFLVGSDVFIAKDAPSGQHGAFFEDDGETGYFYAVDLTESDNVILDAVHIYNVKNVVDRNRPSTFSIVWSEDESKCALLINNYPHATFDFAAKQGYCRTNFPNFPNKAQSGWSNANHSWSDSAIAWLKIEDKK